MRIYLLLGQKLTDIGCWDQNYSEDMFQEQFRNKGFFSHQDHVECYPSWLEDRLPHFWKQSAGNKKLDIR